MQSSVKPDSHNLGLNFSVKAFRGAGHPTALILDGIIASHSLCSHLSMYMYMCICVCMQINCVCFNVLN